MKKRFLIVIVLLAMLSFCFTFTACDKNTEGKTLDLEDGSRPDYDSLFTHDDLSLINAAMSDGASEQTKKQAVMLLYNVANSSRKDTPLSLMVQNSDAGIPSYLGSVIMHGFNLRSGDTWYYQLATDVISAIDFLMKEFAGLLKVAYADGSGDYMYSIVTGSEADCDCSLTNFPYAKFELTKAPTKFSAEDFKEELHYLDSMHEINNMQFCEEIIADGAQISYDSDKGFYTVSFEVNMRSDAELLATWYSMAQKDMQVSGHSIESYNYYRATLQVWDNGYAKYFYSDSDRTASGMASGAPKDEFKYFWVESEIMALLAQDDSVIEAEPMEAPEDYIRHYSGLDIAKARLSDFLIAVIVISCVIAAIIITVIVIEILVRCGKLPKLAARREAKKLRRKEKRNAKKGNKGSADNDMEKVIESDDIVFSDDEASDE